MRIIACVVLGVVLDAVLGVTLDVTVWLLCIVAITSTFLIALFAEDIGEPWATLLILATVIGCTLLAGLR